MDDKHNIPTLTVDEPKNSVEEAELKNLSFYSIQSYIFYKDGKCMYNSVT